MLKYFGEVIYLFMINLKCDVIIFIVMFVDFTHLEEHILQICISESVCSNLELVFISLKVVKHLCKLGITFLGTLEVNSDV
jgi:hypothetical protein